MSDQLDRLHGRLQRTVDRLVARARRDGRQPVLDLTAATQVRLPWFAVRSQVPPEPDVAPDAPAVATIFIFDEIGGSMGVDASALVEEIQAIAEPVIHVRINSPGGSVFDAIAIYNALNHHPAHKVAYVDALAASAASVIAMAGNEIVMMPGSQMMIHDASAMAEGPAAEMGKMQTFLDRQSTNVADLYRLRAGGTVEEWRDLMLAETWAFAEEAVVMGLADRVELPPAAPTPELEATMARAHDLTSFHYRGRRHPPRRAAAGGARPSQARTTERTPPEEPARITAEPVARSAAAAARGEASERRAHALAQEGRSVPVLRTSDQFRSQLRVVRTEMPREVGAARLQGFGSRLQRSSSVSKGGKQLEHVGGHASMYGLRNAYEMWDSFGPYLEWVQQRAGSTSLAKGPDVAFLMNHMGVTMARTKAGTLDLAEDDEGLADDAYVNPDRSDVQILLSSIDDGLITEQSFAFMIDEGSWSDSFDSFCIVRYDIDRGDVSAVNYGANPYTSLAARGQQIMADLDRLPAGLASAAFARLARRADVATECAREPEPTTVPAEPAPPATITRAPVPAGRRITQVEALLGDE